jgi:hypothetical protein
MLKGGAVSALSYVSVVILSADKAADQFQQRNQRFKNDENFINKSFHPFLQ